MINTVKRISRLFVLWVGLTFASGPVLAQVTESSTALSQDLVTCGWDEISAIHIEGTHVSTLWTWKAANSNLPEWCKPLFSTTDDSKPYPDGKVVVTSSGGDTLDGAVALILPHAPSTSNVEFYARAPNAHSADRLPGNRLAVAMSYHPNGNRLAVFDLANSNVEILSVPLFGAHGVLWDAQRKVLWGMADTYLREYELQDWDSNPKLRLISTISLPDIGGHEMSVVANSPNLTIATGSNCWLFNRDTRKFTKHPQLGDIGNVKGISTHPYSGRVVYVRADTNWWTERLRFFSPEQTIQFPGAHFYKARWIQPALAPSATSAFLQSGIDSGGGISSGGLFLNHSSFGASWTTGTIQSAEVQNRTGLIEVIYPNRVDSTVNEFSLPDEWQIQNFGRLGIDPLEDFDSDGSSNFQEYLAGTDPKSQSSVFRPQGTYNEEIFQMSIPTLSGRNYQIWVSRDLNDWILQSTLFGDDTAQVFEFDETTITSGPLCSSTHPSNYFFRIKLLIPASQ